MTDVSSALTDLGGPPVGALIWGVGVLVAGHPQPVSMESARRQPSLT